MDGLIKHADLNGDIHVFSLFRRGPKLTYLSFADDSLLFCGATVEECGKVLNILEAYEGASSEKVNRSKIALFFSKSTTKDIKSNIKLVLGVSEILQYEKYLCLPFLVGNGKKASFNYIKERFWRKL